VLPHYLLFGLLDLDRSRQLRAAEGVR
jgi:hypothetical protein